MDIDTARAQFDLSSIDNNIDRMIVKALLTTELKNYEIYRSLGSNKGHFYFVVKQHLGSDFLPSRTRDLEMRFLQRRATESKTGLTDEDTVSVLSITSNTNNTPASEDAPAVIDAHEQAEAASSDTGTVSPYRFPDPAVEAAAIECLSVPAHRAYLVYDSIMRKEQCAWLVNGAKVREAIRLKYGRIANYAGLAEARTLWLRLHPRTDGEKEFYPNRTRSHKKPPMPQLNPSARQEPVSAPPLTQQPHPDSSADNGGGRQVSLEFNGIKMSWYTNTDNVEDGICKVLNSLKDLVAAQHGDNNG